MKFVCTSDLHGHWRNIGWPDGDVLIVAGDITVHGNLTEVQEFNDWLAIYPYRYKIICAGNHDWAFHDKDKRDKARAAITNGIYLENESVELEGINIFCSPYTPQFFSWAFMKPREQMHTVWDQIPLDTDVLVTHGPPMGQLDDTPRGDRAGCAALLDAVERVKPRYHVFGHIHDQHGASYNEHTQFLNVARCNDAYNPVFLPQTFEI
ncbi:MAG: metallophosphatase domain-containing protein [Patescibacteria group bacterium]